MPNLRTNPIKRKLVDYDDDKNSISGISTSSYDDDADDNNVMEENYPVEDFKVLKNLNLSADELLSLSVGELNKKMKNVNASQVKEVKQLRRTLKNRGYAAICRNKRVEQIDKLEAEKKSLLKEISTLKQERNGQVKVYNELVRQYNNMKKNLPKYNSDKNLFAQVVPHS